MERAERVTAKNMTWAHEETETERRERRITPGLENGTGEGRRGER